MELPKDLDFTQDPIEILNKNIDWILEWNRNFFQNSDNNIDKYIEKINSDINSLKKSSICDNENLIKIYDFRLNILLKIKEECQIISIDNK
jgi:flagellar capping protein FliD